MFVRVTVPARLAVSPDRETEWQRLSTKSGQKEGTRLDVGWLRRMTEKDEIIRFDTCSATGPVCLVGFENPGEKGGCAMRRHSQSPVEMTGR